MTITIRELADTDLESADAVLKLAFGGAASRMHDLWLYRQIQPDGWLAAIQNERIVGTVGATSYEAFAHIGFMAVHPEVQRQGVGMALMEYILDTLEQRGVTSVTLDASEKGRPLYEKLGFSAYDETLVYQRTNVCVDREQIASWPTISPRELDELAEWDAVFFGANRCKVFEVLLRVFPNRAFLQRDQAGRLMGYIFAQHNRIGPWVMRPDCTGAELLPAALALAYAGAVSVTVPAANPGALELMQRYGFEHVRTNRYMGRGVSGPPGQRRTIYAQTSLALG